MNITLIAAMDKGRVIGNNGEIPWMGALPRDLERFKERTRGKTVVMGRVTFDSIKHALPDRNNIVLTRDVGWNAPGVSVINDPRQLFRQQSARKSDDVFIIGGQTIYELFLPFAETLDIAIVEHEFAGDTYFPAITPNEWVVVADEYQLADRHNKFPVRFVLYTRR
jgi:dihydrofolate reductase